MALAHSQLFSCSAPAAAVETSVPPMQLLGFKLLLMLLSQLLFLDQLLFAGGGGVVAGGASGRALAGAAARQLLNRRAGVGRRIFLSDVFPTKK